MSPRLFLLTTLLAVSLLACNGSNNGGTESVPSVDPTASPKPAPSRQTEPPDLRRFVFAAAGDHGANDITAASLSALDQSGAAFYLALGDIDYDQTPTDAAWCDFVRERLPTLGPAFPFQLVSGNHEEQGGPNGDILDHAACLPDRMNSTGAYAAQYYFDYPIDDPLLRVVMISPDLVVGDVTYDYEPGTGHYAWLAGAIDDARAAEIPWVVVGMHKNCITTGQKECEIGANLLNLLVDRRVDLVLQSHDHNYQRSKQLALGRGCPSLEPDSYDSGCAADEGMNARYAKGAGTVIVIGGAFGMPLYPVKPGDPEAGYFAVIDATSNGFTKFTVTGDRIDATFVPSAGDFTDAFTIASE